MFLACFSPLVILNTTLLCVCAIRQIEMRYFLWLLLQAKALPSHTKQTHCGGGISTPLPVLTISARWSGWSTPRPGRFTPRKETRYPLYCWASRPVGIVPETLAPTGFRLRADNLTASRYTNWAIFFYWNSLQIMKETAFIFLIHKLECSLR